MKSLKKQTKLKPKSSLHQQSKSFITKSKQSNKTKSYSAAIPQSYLNQNLVINKKNREIQKINQYKRQISSAMALHNYKSQSRSTKRRSITSMPIKKNYKLDLLNYDIDQLVTEQDIVYTSQQYATKQLKKNINHQIFNVDYKILKPNVTQAAILIQKMWRGYRIRKIVKFYIQLYHKQARVLKNKYRPKKHNNMQIKQLFQNQIQKAKKPKKKLSDIVYITTNENRSCLKSHQQNEKKQQINKNHHNQESSLSSQNKFQPTEVNDILIIEESLNKLKQQQLQKWNQIIGLIQSIPKQQINKNKFLNELIRKSRQNKEKLQILNQPIILSPNKQIIYEQKVQKPESLMTIVNFKNKQQLIFSQNEHPLLKIFQCRLKILKGRQKLELQKLQLNFINKKISKQQFQNKKQRIIGRYLRQRKQINQNKLQLSFGLQKAHQAIIHYKKDAQFVHKITGKPQLIGHSLSSQTLLQTFLKQQIHQQSLSMTPCSSSQSIQSFRRTSTQLQSPASYASQMMQINKHKSNQPKKQDKKLLQLKQSAQRIQNNIQNKLINQICYQIYSNKIIYQLFQPLIDVQNTYNFKKLQDTDIEDFLNILSTQYLPNQEQILQKLNQKINPTPSQLLKILRNVQISGDQNQFYQLIIPEQSFRKIRQFRQLSIYQYADKSNQNQILKKLNLKDRVNFQQKFDKVREKLKKLKKFQKDLQAMYLKSIFNCFNQSILEVKSSYSALNGRSTISAGELAVCMRDSNILLSAQHIKGILTKAQILVLQNIRVKCPMASSKDYTSIFKFQEYLNKQMRLQFNRNEYKWMNFFDQILQIGMMINKEVEQYMIQQVVMELLKDLKQN